MGLFVKGKKNAGLMAIRFQEGGISAACIERSGSGLPVVKVLSFVAIGKSPEATVLEKFGKEMHAGQYRCVNLLGAGEYQMLSVEAPNVPPDELKTAIRWRLKDMLDFHVDDATIDVLAIPVDKNAPVRTHSLYAVAARNQLIAQRQVVFEEAKLPLRVIDIPEMAQRNIASLLEAEGRGLALLSFDADGGLLTISFTGELYLARRIDVSSSQLMQADGEARDALFDRITLELQRSLDHFDRQYHFITVARLMLAPMERSDLRDYLAANLYIPVEELNLETVLDVSGCPELKSSAAQQRYFLTLGTALRHEEKSL